MPDGPMGCGTSPSSNLPDPIVSTTPDDESHAEYVDREQRHAQQAPANCRQVQRRSDGVRIERVRQAHRDHNTDQQHRVAVSLRAATEAAIQGRKCSQHVSTRPLARRLAVWLLSSVERQS